MLLTGKGHVRACLVLGENNGVQTSQSAQKNGRLALLEACVLVVRGPCCHLFKCLSQVLVRSVQRMSTAQNGISMVENSTLEHVGRVGWLSAQRPIGPIGFLDWVLDGSLVTLLSIKK